MSRFTKIAATGKPARANAKKHAAVIDNSTGLMWSAADLGPRMNHDAAAKACADLQLAGHNDWRLPTVEELHTLVDRSRFSPAIDTAAFPTCKSAWYWTSTLTAWSSGCAWLVDFLSGYVSYNGRNSTAFVRAVRRVSPASQ